MTEAEVLRKVLGVVGGTHELVCLPQALPLLARKLDIAAADDVIIRGNDVERRRVGGGIAVGIVLEPVDEACALGNLVRDLSIVALELGDELEGGPSGGKVANRVESERGPEGIAPKEPREARTLACARSAISSNQARAERGIGGQSLDHADARPVVGLLELRVRKRKADGPAEIVAVVLGRFANQIRIRSCQALVVGLRVGQSLGGGRENNYFAGSPLAGRAEKHGIFIRG